MKNVKNTAKKAMALSLALMTMGTVTACLGPKGQNIYDDPTVSYLYVATRDSGLGTVWLDEMAKKFEERYAETSFGENKVGVKVIKEPVRALTGSGMVGTLANEDYDVCMGEDLNYVDYMTSNLLYDISDWVTEELSDGSGTLESKITKEHQAYLKGFNGNYHALPWFTTSNGLTYDAGLFEEKGLWFADANGYKPTTTSTYTGKAYTGRGFVLGANTKKSCGPDGIYDTFDDGLPSSYEEFFYLCEYMAGYKQVTPFIYTGASEHYLNYLFQALTLNWSGKEDSTTMFTFNSGENTVDVITGFNGEEPIIEAKKITKENGYLSTQIAGKYYATKFMKEMFDNLDDYFYARSTNGSFSNLDAQTIFINSALDPTYTPIAMMIEGAYWYQEAADALKASENKYGVDAMNRKFAYMVMPSQETGTVNENQGKPVVVADGQGSHLFVNNNIKDDPETLEVAKKFIQMCFENDSLETVVAKTGLPVAVDYEVSPESYNQMNHYAQSLWDVYSAALKNKSYCTPFSGSKLFLANFPTFKFDTGGWCTYKSGASSYSTVRLGVLAGLSAEEYFLGTGISKEDWDRNYGQYEN